VQSCCSKIGALGRRNCRGAPWLLRLFDSMDVAYGRGDLLLSLRTSCFDALDKTVENVRAVGLCLLRRPAVSLPFAVVARHHGDPSQDAWNRRNNTKHAALILYPALPEQRASLSDRVAASPKCSCTMQVRLATGGYIRGGRADSIGSVRGRGIVGHAVGGTGQPRPCPRLKLATASASVAKHDRVRCAPMDSIARQRSPLAPAILKSPLRLWS